jgi:hypothetical protein
MSYFNNESIPEEERRDKAFQTIVAHRDLLQLAIKKSQPPTYENAFGLINEHSPELYKEIINLLTKKNESDLVKYYKETAEIQTTDSGKEVTALELIEKEITRLNDLLEKDSTKKTIVRRLIEHQVARENLRPVHLTENRILNRDYSKVDRSDYASKHFENDNFIDYKLQNKDILRIRFLHPDKPEHITGTDLIYEQYDLLNQKVRLVFLQYKIWEKGILYMSQNSGLKEQMARMKTYICDNNICKSYDGKKFSDKYRLPYCTGFIRPTDKIQDSESKLMSSGYHLPLCKAIEIAEANDKIDRELIRGQSFTSGIFEELFNSNMIGSRWLDLEELNDFYTKNKIFDISSDRIKLYAIEMKEK